MMQPLTITEIENAFQPAREINTAERFAGRHQAVQDGLYALVSHGTNIAVIGNRGIGKSSFARQLHAISEGTTELLEQLKIPHDGHLDFLPVYFACGTTIKTVDQLLERLLTTSSCLSDWIYDIPGAKKSIERFSPELSAKLFGIGAKISGDKATEQTASPAVAAHSIDTVFTNVCQEIVKADVCKSGLLIIIDEFDQIEDPTGMAGLIKSFATLVPEVKFCLVGVAHDVEKLMKEHESSDRLFAGGIIFLPPMISEELTEIIDIAEQAVRGVITFQKSARDKLVELARGHPYMVHLVGKYALRTAFTNGVFDIDGEMISQALQSIADRGADPVLEARYKKAVGSSPQREVVLRSFAECRRTDGECWTTDAYKLAIDGEVDNASQYVGQLVTDDYGGELEKLRERYYRFKDSLFAAYVLARPPQYK